MNLRVEQPRSQGLSSYRETLGTRLRVEGVWKTCGRRVEDVWKTSGTVARNATRGTDTAYLMA